MMIRNNSPHRISRDLHCLLNVLDLLNIINVDEDYPPRERSDYMHRIYPKLKSTQSGRRSSPALSQPKPNGIKDLAMRISCIEMWRDVGLRARLSLNKLSMRSNRNGCG